MTGDELRRLGLYGNAEGMMGLGEPLLALFRALDGAFAGLGRALGAEELAFVPLVAARDLRRIDYFSSFPHLVTLPVTVEPTDLEAFKLANSGPIVEPLALGRLAPVEAVLPAAACYAVYPALSGTALPDGGRRVTLIGTCFRREERYQPLVRQWCFRMREVVYLGDAAGATAFLDEARARVVALASRWGVPITVEAATDPFFDPARSPRYLHQKLFPTKHELVCGGVALGSFNYHRNFFGEAFAISSAGAPAHTACVAFGLERWLHAVIERHGGDPARWPISPTDEDGGGKGV
jgi:hypothetical protein